MSTQLYTVNQPRVSDLITWINSGEVAIPEIQRPFVWKPLQVSELIDSLFRGFPVGYLITWKNPNVKLKDGSPSAGKRILIDGQQRVTALMAALLGREIMTKDYRAVRIRIAYNPLAQRFAVLNSAIKKDPLWIHDISTQYVPGAKLTTEAADYCSRNPGADKDQVMESLQSLRNVVNNQIGMIELDHQLDIETVTTIFIRVNSQGVRLSQADFAMSKIAVDEKFGGPDLRKAIDYFCHLAIEPSAYKAIESNDKPFTATPYFSKMAWLKHEADDLYDPDYSDMLRVAFTSEFRRGRLQDLVALISGRNFETKQYEEQIEESTFLSLRDGVLRFMNETSFKNLVMYIRSSGFVNPSMIGSKNAINFAYVIYLHLKRIGVPPAAIERAVRRWFVMSLLTGRYGGSSETIFDEDIRQIDSRGYFEYEAAIIASQLSDNFWQVTLPEYLNTPVIINRGFRVFQAAQVKLGDKGFLSKDISVHELIAGKSDVHHVFPVDYLKKNGKQRADYNQIANYVIAQSEINIAISNKAPEVYFAQLMEQVNGGPKRYGNIDKMDDLRLNLEMNCIPEEIFSMTVTDYPGFLHMRRQLMAARIRKYFEIL